MPGRMAQLPKPSLFRQHQRAPTALFLRQHPMRLVWGQLHLSPFPGRIPIYHGQFQPASAVDWSCVRVSIQKESEGKEDKIFYRSDHFQDGTAVESEVMRQIAPLVPWTDPSTPKGFICKAFANNYSKLNANLIN